MSTATAEPEVFEAPIVQQPDGNVLFLAKRSDLRLVKEGRYPIIVPHTGQRIGETRGVVVAFVESKFACPTEGEITIMDPGGAGQATLFAHDTVDERGAKVQGLLSWLEKHPRCGDPNEGFVKVEPKMPPMSFEEQQALSVAATEWDIETLQRIVDQERAGWGREEIIRIAEGSLERITAAEERIREEQRGQIEREEAAARKVDERVAQAEARAAAAEKALADAKKAK